MSSSSGPAPINMMEMYGLKNQIRTLVNNELRAICRSIFLPVSGTKAVLQNRIFAYIDQAINNGESLNLEALRFRSFNHAKSPPPSIFARAAGQTSAASNITPPAHTFSRQALSSVGLATNNHFGGSTTTPSRSMPRPSIPASNSSCLVSPPYAVSVEREGQVVFKKTPFYAIRASLSPCVSLKLASRNSMGLQTVGLALTFDSGAVSAIQTNSARVMLFCARDPVPYQECNLGFPFETSVQINGVKIKGLYKGLKGKTESVMPTDLTDHMDPSQNKTYRIDISYATPGTSKYYLRLYLVDRHSPAVLSDKLQERPLISKESVVKEIISKNNDPDITATHINTSLRDPLSLTRMTLPCRGLNCSHFQCFDGSTFLSMQEQAPTWTCPLCSKPIRYEELAIDGYMFEILKETPKSCESVTVEPDGTWHVPAMAAVDVLDDSDSDDDYSDNKEVIDIQSNPRTAEQTPRPVTGQKRQRDVIDLTLSGDEDEGYDIAPPASRRLRTAEPTTIGSSPTNLYRQVCDPIQHSSSSNPTPNPNHPHLPSFPSSLARPGSSHLSASNNMSVTIPTSAATSTVPELASTTPAVSSIAQEPNGRSNHRDRHATVTASAATASTSTTATSSTTTSDVVASSAAATAAAAGVAATASSITPSSALSLSTPAPTTAASPATVDPAASSLSQSRTEDGVMQMVSRGVADLARLRAEQESRIRGPTVQGAVLSVALPTSRSSPVIGNITPAVLTVTRPLSGVGGTLGSTTARAPVQAAVQPSESGSVVPRVPAGTNVSGAGIGQIGRLLSPPSSSASSATPPQRPHLNGLPTHICPPSLPATATAIATTTVTAPSATSVLPWLASPIPSSVPSRLPSRPPSRADGSGAQHQNHPGSCSSDCFRISKPIVAPPSTSSSVPSPSAGTGTSTNPVSTTTAASSTSSSPYAHLLYRPPSLSASAATATLGSSISPPAMRRKSPPPPSPAKQQQQQQQQQQQTVSYSSATAAAAGTTPLSSSASLSGLPSSSSGGSVTHKNPTSHAPSTSSVLLPSSMIGSASTSASGVGVGADAGLVTPTLAMASAAATSSASASTSVPAIVSAAASAPASATASASASASGSKSMTAMDVAMDVLNAGRVGGRYDIEALTRLFQFN